MGRLAVMILLLLAGATGARAQFSLESRRPAEPAPTAPAPLPAPPVVAPPDSTPAAPVARRPPGIPPRLRQAADGLDPRFPTRVTLLSRDRLVGESARVAGDTLWLAEGGGVPLADIARLEQLVPGDGVHSRWAGVAGVLLGGVLGGAIGAALDDPGRYDSYYNDESGRTEAIMVGAAMGMVVLGLPATRISGGPHSGRDAWFTLYPPGLVGAEPEYVQGDAAGVERRRRAPGVRPRARLAFDTGWSTGSNGPLASAGVGYTAALLTRLAPNLEYGPEFDFHALDTVVDVPARTTSAEQTVIPPFVSLGVALRCQSPAPGLRPWADGGVAVCLSSNMYIGTHVGTGCRWRDARGRDYGVFVRRRIPLARQLDAVDGFWTVGAGFTFGL